MDSTPPESLGSAASLLRALADAPGAPGPLRAGQVIAAKYTVERAIGEGGMGVVYRARDTRLDRDVAIKIGSAVSPHALARMEREAQALARLSHPNVVVVYEVGEVEGRVFVAMEELVAGGTARAWLLAETRTPREIVALYCAAGDGLAAAHAAGIVHRDFKPDNVLVGDDGRPRVADFGLARADASTHEHVHEPSARAPLADVTHDGAIVGTPAYMAPEQLAGDAVDARADQFAFAAALWEALHGVRPFTGNTPTEVASAIESSEPRAAAPAGRARRTPRHVALALRRALRVDPGARWPSLAALLAELRRDPARRRRNALLGAGAAAAIALAVIVPRALRDVPDPCDGGPSQIAAAWSPAQAARIRAAFAAIGRDWAPATGARAIDALDRSARAWTVSYRAVCEAKSAAWSPSLHDRGMECLGRARNQIAALAEQLGAAGERDAAHADTATAGVPSPARCSDPSYVARLVPPPSDPWRAAVAERIDAVLARVHAMFDLGHDESGLVLLPPQIATATAIGDDVERVRADVDLAMFLTERDDYARSIPILRDAYFRARDAGDDPDAEQAAYRLSDALLGDRRTTEAEDWARIALTDAHRLDDRYDVIRAHEVLALIARDREDLAHARDDADRAVELADATHDPATRAEALASRAPVDGERGDHEAEVDDTRAALGIMDKLVGADHPRSLRVRVELAFALDQLGDGDEAMATERQVIELAGKSPGPDTLPALAAATAALGGSLLDEHHDAEALPVIERAIDLLTQVGGVTVDVASAMNNRGEALVRIGRTADAIATVERVIEIVRDPAHPDPYLEAAAHTTLSGALLAVDRLAEAETEALASIAGWQKIGGQPAREAFAEDELGLVLVQEHRPAEARAAYHRGLALLDGTDAPPSIRADIELHLSHVK